MPCTIQVDPHCIHLFLSESLVVASLKGKCNEKALNLGNSRPEQIPIFSLAFLNDLLFWSTWKKAAQSIRKTYDLAWFDRQLDIWQSWLFWHFLSSLKYSSRPSKFQESWYWAGNDFRWLQTSTQKRAITLTYTVCPFSSFLIEFMYVRDSC